MAMCQHRHPSFKKSTMASLTPITGTLGAQRAAHLLRRATYKPTKAMIARFAAYTITDAMTALFSGPTASVAEPLHGSTNMPFIPTAGTTSPPSFTADPREKNYVISWWMREAQLCESIHYKLAFFLHSVFITSWTVADTAFFYDYLALLGFYSDKSILNFARKVTRSNQMHVYLGNRFNTAVSPNENYAREFLELFTIQKGPVDAPGSYTNYTETDVQQGARVLTGFTTITAASRLSYLDADCSIPLGTKSLTNHDKSSKTFSAKFGSTVISGATTTAAMDTELDTYINMVFSKTATAQAYARKLYRYFVKSEITAEAETDIIGPLASNLLANNYDLKIAVKLLLSSTHFFDEDDSTSGDEAYGALIKSPLELCLGMLNQFSVTSVSPATNTGHVERFYTQIRSYMQSMAMDLFDPPSVNGYVAYKDTPFDNLWATTATIANRYNLMMDRLITGYTALGATTKLDTVSFIKDSGYFTDPGNATTLVDELLEYLLVDKPTGSRYDYFKEALLNGLSATSWLTEWNRYLSTGSTTAVRVATDRLIKAVVKSPEYQLC
jgi:uncharacterized protein (DUF1800 family)